MKVEWICTCRTNECSVYNQCYKNPLWNCFEEFIIDRDLLGPRTRNKSFNPSMRNRLMYFAFHTESISNSKKKMRIQFNLSDTKSRV